jgi:hypothetical protein
VIIDRIRKSSACSLIRDWMKSVLFSGVRPALSQSSRISVVYPRM